MCEMPLPVPLVVTVHVASPVIGNELSGEQLTEWPLRSFPDFTQRASRVVPAATVNDTEFSLSEVTVMPGAGLNGGFWPSHFPSFTGHVSAWAVAFGVTLNAAATASPTATATTNRIPRLIPSPLQA